KPLRGEFAALSPQAATQGDNVGALVRWGGRIVKVEPGQDSTCFEMVSTRLRDAGRPYAADDRTEGRFLACRAGFYDPAVFEKNREVTFTGRIDGYENRRIGEYDYRFPKISADVVYLWPERDTVQVIAPYPYPAFAPWPYRGWWGW